MLKRWAWPLALVLLALLLYNASSLLWWCQRGRALDVLVVDKTVPFHNYREHAAVPWLLSTLKLRDRRGRFLDATRDYLGFDPASRTGRELSAADLEGRDLLFITDTYGVYTGDYARPGEEAALERSQKIYGGLSADEASAIEGFVGRGGMVVAEFNTFASPTSDAVRARMESLFGVRWSGWVGRYWPDLQDAGEVPRWIGHLYERVHHRPFDVAGAGLVFVREDQDIVVLRAGEDLGRRIVTQERTSHGALYDLPERAGFWFWMDIVEPRAAEVLAEHVIDVTAAGAAKLAEHRLPTRFPALSRRGDAFYFAGDFVDNTIDLGDPKRRFVIDARRGAAVIGFGPSETAFFWGWYVPIAARLFSSRAH